MTRAISLRPITPEPEPVENWNPIQNDVPMVVIEMPQITDYRIALDYADRILRERVAGDRQRVVRYTCASGTFTQAL